MRAYGLNKVKAQTNLKAGSRNRGCSRPARPWGAATEDPAWAGTAARAENRREACGSDGSAVADHQDEPRWEACRPAELLSQVQVAVLDRQGPNRRKTLPPFLRNKPKRSRKQVERANDGCFLSKRLFETKQLSSHSSI